MNKRGERRDDSPGDHDPADPLASTPALDQECAGDLENEIADEEYPHAETECRLGEPERLEIGLHRELGEADVDAVDVGDHIAYEQDREEPDVGFGSGAVQRASPGRGRHGASSRWVCK